MNLLEHRPEMSTDNLSVGFIGAGRVASSLALALAAAGLPPRAVHSRSRASAERLARGFPDCLVCDAAQQVLANASLVFVTVPDDAIEALVGSLTWQDGVAVVHCSGALGLEVLRPAAEQQAAVGAFHPLQLFPDASLVTEASAVALLRGSAIAIGASQPLRGQLESLARRLGSRPLTVPPEARAAYHAGSHYAAAFICVLLAEAQQIFERIGIDGECASWGLQALARGTLDAIDRGGPARAMAGAYARGDLGTAARHLKAMDDLGAETGHFYRELARRSVALARQAGRIDEEGAAAMHALLAEPPPALPVHLSGSTKP